MKKNVAVLYGGDSSEREVSLDTGKAIINNLDKNKYNVLEILITKDDNKKWITTLVESKIDIALIALHGGIGENGSVQGLLECLHIPYVGSKVVGSSIGMDKFLSKQLLLQNKLKVPKGILICQEDEVDKNAISSLSLPLIVKPNNEGSSVGITLAESIDKALESILDLQNKKLDVIVEEFIKGQEITCGVIETKEGLTALDILDIDTTRGFYDYYAKYEADDTRIVPSSLSAQVQRKVKNTAIKTFKVLKAVGYGRIDMIVKDDIPYILEINTLPGMTSHSLIPKSLNERGISYSEFLDNLIESVLNK